MRVLDGKMPAGGGAATLFIDWYGVGGRVGPVWCANTRSRDRRRE